MQMSATTNAVGSLGRMSAIPAALAACAVALSGCWGPGSDCMTLDEYDRIAAENPELVGVKESVSVGEIVTENPSNWMVNAKFTGESCTVAVEIRNGKAYALVSFLEDPVELAVPLSERDFYMGLVDRERALVVQQVPEGAGASLVPFGESGKLQYGDCAKRESWYRECHIAPAGR